MPQRLRAALLAALALLTSIILRPYMKASDGEQLKERFLREAPPRWDEYQKWADRLQGDIALAVHRDGKLD